MAEHFQYVREIFMKYNRIGKMQSQKLARKDSENPIIIKKDFILLHLGEK